MAWEWIGVAITFLTEVSDFPGGVRSEFQQVFLPLVPCTVNEKGQHLMWLV